MQVHCTTLHPAKLIQFQEMSRIVWLMRRRLRQSLFNHSLCIIPQLNTAFVVCTMQYPKDSTTSPCMLAVDTATSSTLGNCRASSS